MLQLGHGTMLRSVVTSPAKPAAACPGHRETQTAITTTSSQEQWRGKLGAALCPTVRTLSRRLSPARGNDAHTMELGSYGHL